MPTNAHNFQQAFTKLFPNRDGSVPTDALICVLQDARTQLKQQLVMQRDLAKRYTDYECMCICVSRSPTLVWDSVSVLKTVTVRTHGSTRTPLNKIGFAHTPRRVRRNGQIHEGLPNGLPETQELVIER